MDTNDSDIQKQSSDNLLIATDEYCGTSNKCGLRTCEGVQHWKREYHQTYRGQFLQDNLHGDGTYTIQDKDGQKTIYNGLFYTNQLEGYGQVVYEDNHYFEGLFKGQRRFGPGVHTYPNGMQDVGLWEGKSLMRLSCAVNSEWMPRVAKSPTAKAKILKYRTMVPVCRRGENKALAILKMLNANETVCEESYRRLLNECVRNNESVFFDRRLYDENFFQEEDCTIEVAINPDDILETSLKQRQSNTSVSNGKNNEPEEDRDSTESQSQSYCECPILRQARVDDMREEMRCIENNLEDVRDTIENIKIYLKSLEWENAEEENEEGGSDRLGNGASERDLWGKANCMDVAQDKLTNAMQQEDQLLARKSAIMKIFDVWGSSPRRKSYDSELGEEEEGEKGEWDYDSYQSVQKIAIEEPVLTRKVVVSDLLAWNNERISINMLKHCFLHRYSEQNVSFNVSKLLTGERKLFRSAGEYEQGCVNFLRYSSDGKIEKLSDLLRAHDLNPDLCDARGNSGIMFATARDKVNAIRTLMNFGGNVDIFNDESFTPLTLCLSRYLSVLSGVTDWERAFLPNIKLSEDEQIQINEWNVFKSVSDMSNTSSNCSTDHKVVTKSNVDNFKSTESLTAYITNQCPSSFYDIDKKMQLINFFADVDHPISFHQDPYQNKCDEQQPFILDSPCIKPPVEKKHKNNGKKGGKKGGKRASSKKDTTVSSVSSLKLSTKEADKVQFVDQATELHLRVIFQTLTTLLNCGANPNIGEMPLPPLLLSVFSKNIEVIRELLKFKADPNVSSLDENMTALHYLASLPVCHEHIEMCNLLLEYSANPNYKTNTSHWIEEKNHIIGKAPTDDVPDNGKTPLHLLCMRYDFTLDAKENNLHEIAKLLIHYGADVDDFYLGHTPLSLAILRGNVKLIEFLLDTERVNPNQKLGENMGVPLTVLILKRYANVLPAKTAFAVYDALIGRGANPFNDADDTGCNAIDFMKQEHASAEVKTDKKNKTNKKKDRGSKSKKSKGTQGAIKDYLLTSAKDFLSKRVKLLATKYLYDLVYEDLLGDEFTEALAKFLTPKESVRYLQILIHSGKIKKKYYSRSCFWDLTDYLMTKSKKHKKSAKSPERDVDGPHIKDLLESIELKKLPKDAFRYYKFEPGLDRVKKKYVVCFHCLTNKGDLIRCPECELVYFCSEECNRLSIKMATWHKCNVLFYSHLKALRDECLRNGESWEPPSKLKQRLDMVKAKREEKEALLAKQMGVALDGKHRHHAEESLRGLFKHSSKKGKTGSDEYDQKVPKITYSIPLHDKGSGQKSRKDHSKSLQRDGSPTGSPSAKNKRSGLTKSGRRQLDGSGGKQRDGSGGRKRDGGGGRQRDGSRGRQRDGSGKRRSGPSTSASTSKSRSKGRSRSSSRSPDALGKKRATSLDRLPNVRFDARTRFEPSRLFDRKLPDRNRMLIEKLSKLFPDFDISKLLLPYACYSDGELYYKFNTILCCDTYSNL